jgi:lipopolysaccharide export system permease protein
MFNSPTPLSRPWWKHSLRLWGYITKEAIAPFLMALGVIMFVFLLQFLMRFIDRIVGKGLDIWTILQLIAFNLAWMVVLAVPMAVLVACVMAFGSLSSSNELTAMRSAGVSLGRMLFPLLALGIMMAWLDLEFNNKVLPDANHKAKDLMTDINRKKPMLAVEPGRFTADDEIPGYAILARRSDPVTNLLYDVTIYDHSHPGTNRMLTAKTAKIAFTRDFRNVVLTLNTGEIHELPPSAPGDYRHGGFDEYTVQVPTSGFDFIRGGESERSDRELSAQDLMKHVDERRSVLAKQVQMMRAHLMNFATHVTTAQSIPATTPVNAENDNFQMTVMNVQNDVSTIKSTDEDIDSYLVEVHKKYAIPAACIIFTLIGVPLGALAKRSGVGAGVGLSIGFFVLYWIFLIGGEKLADRDVISPFMGMWGGNIILLAIGAYLTYRVASEAPPMALTRWLNNIRIELKSRRAKRADASAVA